MLRIEVVYYHAEQPVQCFLGKSSIVSAGLAVADVAQEAHEGLPILGGKAVDHQITLVFVASLFAVLDGVRVRTSEPRRGTFVLLRHVHRVHDMLGVIRLVAVTKVIVREERECMLMLRVGVEMIDFVVRLPPLGINGHTPHGTATALGAQQCEVRVFVDEAA